MNGLSQKKNPFLMNGYILDLVTCFDNRGLYQALQCKDSNYRLISEFLFWIDPEIMPP